MIPLANHLWQSTVFGAAVWLLALVLRKNRAALRYGLWFTASLKFAIPFSLLVSLGGMAGWRAEPTAIQPHVPFLVNEIAQPFTKSAPAPLVPVPLLADAPPEPSHVPAILLGVWFSGVCVVLSSWAWSFRTIRAAMRAAKPLCLNLPIRAMSSPTRLEPGVFGIRNPVLLLPEGLTERLTREQLEGVLAHELCHVRRRDNVTAAIHMVIEGLFWFHPLVWWIEDRLVEERERACDQAALRITRDPEAYAEGILAVCKFYVEAPVVCVSGVTGSNLKKRIEEIMAPRVALRLSLPRKILLATVAAAVVSGPIAIGLAQSRQEATAPISFEVATIKPNKTGAMNSGFKRFHGGMLNATNITLKALTAFAYDIEPGQIAGGPRWLDSERYDVLAKPSSATAPQDLSMKTIRRRTQTLLADRFQLTLHKETRELPVFILVVGNGGPKHLQPPKGNNPDLVSNDHHVTCEKASMAFFAKVFLTGQTGRPVLDRTGIQGDYDFELEWSPDISPPDPSGPSLFGALQQQLGLKLEAAKGPVEVLVIDRAEKPSAN